MLKNKLKKILAVLVSAAMVLALTACGGGEKPAPESKPNDTNQTQSSQPNREDPTTSDVEQPQGPDCVMVRQAMIDTTDMAAVAYLGWYEDYYDYYDYSQIEEYIDSTFIEEDIPFVGEIDEDHFVPHIGGQLFCIVPADENAVITVYDHFYDEENYESVYGDVLYYSDDGQPIIIMGNESEIMPNLFVEIIDSNGNMLEYFPVLSGMDGRLDLPYDAPTVMDITSYEKLGYVSENDYDYVFDPALLYYGENWTAYVDTINDDTVAVGFWFDEYGNMEMCYEVYGGTGYEVYYEGYWYPAEDANLPDSSLVFELTLVEDYSDIQMASSEIYTIVSFVYDTEYEILDMYYEDYDYLLGVEEYLYYTLNQAMG